MQHGMTIGRYTPRFPLIQGGMGVRISGGNLAGHVARCGGVGLVASAGLALNSRRFDGRNYFEADLQALQDEIRKAYRIAPDGIIGVNTMLATTDSDDLVRAACEAGAKLVVMGAGLPTGLPALTSDHPEVALVPIVSSVRAAEIIARKWERNFQRLPDAVVVEDPLTAGGHLGESLEGIEAGTHDQYGTVRGVKALFRERWGVAVPIVAAGGIWDAADVAHALEQGADGVQMASRFVCTEECDADPAFKQVYLDCGPEDIGLIMSPAGLPGRAVLRNQEQVRDFDLEAGTRCPHACLRKCTYKTGQERFCIVTALDRAQRGAVDTGLVFCGSNAWKSERITTVQAIFEELFGAAADLEVGEAVNG